VLEEAFPYTQEGIVGRIQSLYKRRFLDKNEPQFFAPFTK
jgi:hypothetical protein